MVVLNLLVGYLTFKDGYIDFKSNSTDYLTTPMGEESEIPGLGQRSSFSKSVARIKKDKKQKFEENG